MAGLEQVATGRDSVSSRHLGAFKMQILIVGIGALGGTIAARAIRTGLPVRLAARNTDSADALRRSGLRVSGIGGEVKQTLSTLPQLRITKRAANLI
jgi:ketopantoate reductase